MVRHISTNLITHSLVTMMLLRVAPNIYFLGHAGSVIVNGLKIAGASGIYKQKDYKMGEP